MPAAALVPPLMTSLEADAGVMVTAPLVADSWPSLAVSVWLPDVVMVTGIASVLWPAASVAVVSEPLVLPESVITSEVENVARLP